MRVQAGAFECVVPAIHALEATRRPTLSLLRPVLGRLKKRFSHIASIVHTFSGKKVVVPCEKIHPAVQDCRTAFLKELDVRFTEKVGHEEDILTATALDPRYIQLLIFTCLVLLFIKPY
jgi:hypothetical protein